MKKEPSHEKMRRELSGWHKLIVVTKIMIKYYLRLMKIFAIKTEIWRMIMEDDIHVKNTFH